MQASAHQQRPATNQKGPQQSEVSTSAVSRTFQLAPQSEASQEIMDFQTLASNSPRVAQLAAFAERANQGKQAVLQPKQADHDNPQKLRRPGLQQNNRYPIQRHLINNQGYDLQAADVQALQTRYPAQAAAIQTHAAAPGTYIVDEESNPGTVTFHSYQAFPDQREHTSLVRHPFSQATQQAVRLPAGAGFHRRHIISNHLMRLALDHWLTAHPGQMTQAQAQALLDRLNNFEHNLIPGPGAENSAIGMFTNHAAGIQRGAQAHMGGMAPEEFSANLGANLGFYTGFQQHTQATLVDPVLPAFHDPQIAGAHASAMDFAQDLEVSTDFDWPDGADPQMFDDWNFTFNRFIHLRDNPGDWSREMLDALVNHFLALPQPTP